MIGYDTLNEPSEGWIGFSDLRTQDTSHQLGASPTPYQSMLLGDGIPVEVDYYEIKGLGVRKTGTRVLNAQGLRAWQDEKIGIWRANGVWNYDERGEPRLVKRDYFTQVEGQTVDFPNDFLKPFINRFGLTSRGVNPPTLIFIEGVPQQPLPTWTPDDIPNVVDASHCMMT